MNKPSIRREEIPADCFWNGQHWHSPPGLDEERNSELLHAASHYDLIDRLRDYVAARERIDEAEAEFRRAENSLRRTDGRRDYADLPTPPWRIGDHVVAAQDSTWTIRSHYTVTKVTTLED
jgi:hypothetical protein